VCVREREREREQLNVNSVPYLTWKAEVGNEGKYYQHVTFINISRVIPTLFSNLKFNTY